MCSSLPSHCSMVQFHQQSKKGMGLESGLVFLRIMCLHLGRVNSGKRLQSQWLINRTEIYLPALTKLIVISTFVPSFLLLMNGDVLGENMVTLLDIACFIVNSMFLAEAAPLKK